MQYGAAATWAGEEMESFNLPETGHTGNSAVQCSAVQCSAVHCSAVQCSAVYCNVKQFSGCVQYSAVQ